MGTITGNVIITRAQKTLLDETGVSWSTAELLDYLVAGFRAIVATKPDAYIVHDPVFALAAGTLQTLPAGGVQILDVIKNSAGGAVRQIEKDWLDHSNPTWHAATAAPTLHYISDKRNPKHFHVFPPAVGGATVEAIYSSLPPAYTDPTTAIPLDDFYDGPLHNWIVAYAYAKNSKRGDLNKSNAYFTLFGNAIGMKTTVQMAFAPLTPDEAPRGVEGQK